MRGTAALWLTAAFTLICLFVILLPSSGKQDNDLQIRAGAAGQPVPDGFYVYQKLHEKNIPVHDITLTEQGLRIHLEKPQQQDVARRVLLASLPKGIIITSSPASTGFNRFLPKTPPASAHLR